jgi:hypothetical protein
MDYLAATKSSCSTSPTITTSWWHALQWPFIPMRPIKRDSRINMVDSGRLDHIFYTLVGPNHSTTLELIRTVEHTFLAFCYFQWHDNNLSMISFWSHIWRYWYPSPSCDHVKERSDPSLTKALRFDNWRIASFDWAMPMHNQLEEIKFISVFSLNSLFKLVEGRLVYLIGRASIKSNKREVSSNTISYFWFCE